MEIVRLRELLERGRPNSSSESKASHGVLRGQSWRLRGGVGHEADTDAKHSRTKPLLKDIISHAVPAMHIARITNASMTRSFAAATREYIVLRDLVGDEDHPEIMDSLRHGYSCPGSLLRHYRHGRHHRCDLHRP